MQIVPAVDRANELQKKRMAQKIAQHYGGPESLKGKRFAMWGLSFKPNTDDMREAASLTILADLHEMGASVCAYDPEAMTEARHVLEDRDWDVAFAKSSYEALEGADALIVVTEWNEFRRPDFEKVRAALAHPTVFDGRNLYEPARMKELGFVYYAVGRTPVNV